MNNFKIDRKNGIVSEEFLRLYITDFTSAADFVAHLPYHRNTNKNNILCIFEDHCGTCSTKHAVLRKLAVENRQLNIKLMLGIFKMDDAYAPSISQTLEKAGLKYIPEAHNYLKIENTYSDFTKKSAKYSHFKDKILFETEIEFDEINTEKISIHKNFLKDWVIKNTHYSPEQIWKIREKCIEDLHSADK